MLLTGYIPPQNVKTESVEFQMTEWEHLKLLFIPYKQLNEYFATTNHQQAHRPQLNCYHNNTWIPRTTLITEQKMCQSHHINPSMLTESQFFPIQQPISLLQITMMKVAVEVERYIHDVWPG
jgi:hypothetical protein